MENKECKYHLPCGWCDKKDKQCDFNNDAIDKQEETPATVKNANVEVLPYRVPNDTEFQTVNALCNHEWECVGLSTAGSKFRCKKCNATKTEPFKPHSLYEGNHCEGNKEYLTLESASAKGEPSSSQTTKDDYPFTYTGK